MSKLYRLRKLARGLQVPALSEAVADKGRILGERALLELARSETGLVYTDEDEAEPLVTVRIATYNRGQMVVDRAINSALRQTYQRLEVLVVGDACDASTAAAVMNVTDPRVRFINLPSRGLYPRDPKQRWYVAGATPMNAALHLARGSWIAPCDDDDEFTDDHVERLLAAAKARRLEFIYGDALFEQEPGSWVEIGGWPPGGATISHGAVMYSLGLRFMRYSETCWRMRQPTDYNLWMRMQAVGVRMGYEAGVVYRHYLEADQRAKVVNGGASATQ